MLTRYIRKGGKLMSKGDLWLNRSRKSWFSVVALWEKWRWNAFNKNKGVYRFSRWIPLADLISHHNTNHDPITQIYRRSNNYKRNKWISNKWTDALVENPSDTFILGLVRINIYFILYFLWELQVILPKAWSTFKAPGTRI